MLNVLSQVGHWKETFLNVPEPHRQWAAEEIECTINRRNYEKESIYNVPN